jgi:hypothetical protein
LTGCGRFMSASSSSSPHIWPRRLGLRPTFSLTRFSFRRAAMMVTPWSPPDAEPGVHQAEEDLLPQAHARLLPYLPDLPYLPYLPTVVLSISLSI